MVEISAQVGTRTSIDPESLAQDLHEAWRATAIARASANKEPVMEFLGWGEIADEAREGRRIQARWLLERYDMTRKGEQA